MAFYRQVQLSFWTDEKVSDEFTPEDKYFYLYLFTNPQTNLCGCYEVSWTNTTIQTGYNKESIIRLINRFENVHNVIMFSKETKEILLLNWSKYNWTSSARFLIPLKKEIEEVKNSTFKNILQSLFNQILSGAKNNKKITDREREMLENIAFFDESEIKNIPYSYGIDTSVTVTDTVTDNNTVTDSYSLSIKEIIDYLNLKCNKKYTYTNKSFNRLITARLKEGHTIEDFKTVIDKKYFQWHDNEFAQYLKPSTLFAPSHFEEYLNEENNYKKKAANYTEAVNNRFEVVKSWMESTGGMDGE